MSTLTRAAAYTARIAALTAAAPVLACAAASAATAKLAGWELQQLASSPLSAGPCGSRPDTASWPPPTASAQPRRGGSRGTPGMAAAGTAPPARPPVPVRSVPGWLP